MKDVYKMEEKAVRNYAKGLQIGYAKQCESIQYLFQTIGKNELVLTALKEELKHDYTMLALLATSPVGAVREFAAAIKAEIDDKKVM